ncbi:MAG: radical SAM protein [Desulfovibrionaceae bacterium]|nr:radical SAM protein [Desulfovibrionaceae bacterium]
MVSQVFTLDGREMILDADMGLLLPHALAEIKMNLDLVRQFYSVFGAQAVEQHRAFYAQPIVGVYQPRSFADSPQSRLLRWALPLAVFCLGLGGLIICLSNVCVRAVCLAWCIFGALFLRNRQITDLAGALCLAGAAALFIPQEKISPLLDIRPEDGHCWVAPRPRLSPLLALAYEQPGDSLKNPQASRAAVLEAGKALALPHAAHDDIRRLGGGRYSHWREAVYFSSRDNSDPTVNGRSYTLLSPLQPRVWIYFLTAFSLLVLIGHITLRLRQQKRSRPLPVLHSLHYKIITIKDDAPQEDTNNSCVTLSAGDLAWLDRFPALKAAVRLKSGDRQVENALLQNGKIQLPNTTETIHDISMELPYYTCDSLYKDHVVLPLDVYVKKIVPTWINEKAPSYFYSALVLFGEAGMFVFDHNFNGYADFIQYIARNIDSQSNMPAMRWGLKVLASKLPNPIAASREICFHLGHDDISLPLSITISPTNACNLRCTICGSQDHIDRNKIPRAFIKREVFEKLAETMFPFCHVVELNSLGEPTLHKDFGYFIELINNYDCKLWLLTNGTNLTEEILGALEQARGNLSLSIDATGTIFEQQRVNASWKQVEANVRKLMAVRDKSKLAVTLYPTLTRKTAADAVPLCIWADEMGLDAVDFHYYDPIYDGIEQCPTDEEKAALEKSLLAYIRRYEPAASISLQLRQLHPQTRTLRNYAERAVGKIITSANKWQSSSNISQTPSLTQKFPFGRRYYYTNLPKTSLKQNEAHPWYVCVAPLSNAEFNLAGDFSVCCRTQKTLFGSGLTDESFFAAWFGEPIQAVRRSFLRENPTADCMPECKGCIAQYGHID